MRYYPSTLNKRFIRRQDTMNKSIIFCQAPIEIPAVIGLYDKLINQNKEITIISLRTDSYKKFFEYLGLNARLLYWEEINLFDIKNIFCPCSLQKKIEAKISTIDLWDSEIYFTSRFDSQLALYLNTFIKTNIPITYCYAKDNIWIKKPNAKVGIKQIIKFTVEYLLTGCNVRYFKTGDYVYLPEIKIFNTSVINVTKDRDLQTVLDKYMYRPKQNDFRKAIFFTEPYRNRFQSEKNYNDLNLIIVERLKSNGFYVIMKGHPRIGAHPLLIDSVDEIIPEYIPSEFIDVRNFDLAIGFVSTALTESSKFIPAYSVLNICEIINKTEYEYWKDFLEKVGENRIQYISSISELNHL